MKILSWFISIIFAVFLLTLAVKITLNTKQIYYFDIDYLNVEDYTVLSKTEIKEHYSILIDYLQPMGDDELEFPKLAMSEKGRIHFVDVKNIFVFFEYTMYITLIISSVGIYYLIKKKEFTFLRNTAILLFLIPLLLAVPFIVSFNKTFDLFHEIVFTNDYWEFNSTTDPIIDLLPEAFFMHMAIFIMFILIIQSTILYYSYKKLR